MSDVPDAIKHLLQLVQTNGASYINDSPSTTPSTRKSNQQVAKAISEHLLTLSKSFGAVAGQDNNEDDDEPGLFLVQPPTHALIFADQFDPVARRFEVLQVVASSAHAQKVTPQQLVRQLTSPPPANRLANEDEAIIHLLVGYEKPADNAEWGRLFAPYISLQSPWSTIIEELLLNDEEEDKMSRLSVREQYVVDYPSSERAAAFIGFVVRTIETLKLAIEWETHDNSSAGRKWKQKYVLQMMLTEHPTFKEEYTNDDGELNVSARVSQSTNLVHKKFKKRHEKFVTHRNLLLLLYNIAGVSLLLDPFWNVPSEKGGGRLPFRTSSLRPLLEHLVGDIPLLETTGQPCTKAKHASDLEVLKGILDTLVIDGTTTVSDYVQHFVDKFPPSCL
ncbi:hypothetical protein BDQ17DRAFT_1348150 [Cyathus striatus]|nr:hypothetical protein BDQ17DRAFT_1348150 [Cyathus striatus]